jgi:hypothetical protein
VASEHLSREQQCALHLLDLCRAYPGDPARPQALAALQEHAARGAAFRKQAELARAAQARSSSAFSLVMARRRLIKLIRRRGGLAARSEKRRRTHVVDAVART